MKLNEKRRERDYEPTVTVVGLSAPEVENISPPRSSVPTSRGRTHKPMRADGSAPALMPDNVGCLPCRIAHSKLGDAVMADICRSLSLCM